MVPEEALVPLGARQYVFRIEPDGKGGQQARRLEARIGLRVDGKVELLDGVSVDDRVVTAGHGRLARSELSPVRIIDLENPAARGTDRPPGGAPRAASGATTGANPGGASGAASGGIRGMPAA